MIKLLQRSFFEGNRLEYSCLRWRNINPDFLLLIRLFEYGSIEPRVFIT